MALQSFTITVGAQVDVNGKNYIAGQVVYIKKLNGTLASIYSDLGGLSPIPQDGFSNVTNVDGQFTFYVETGEYNAESGGKVTPITVVGSDYFNSKINEVVLELSKSRGFRVVGDFASGFTYELPNDVGVDGSGNYWIYTDVNALPVVVSAGTTPSAPTYTQTNFNAAANVVVASGGNAEDRLNNAKVDNGSAASPSISFIVDTDTGIYRKSTDSISIVTNGQERINARADGRVGINTDGINIEAQLHVEHEQKAIGILSRGKFEGSTAAPYVNNDVILCETYNKTLSDSFNRSWAISCSNAYHDIPAGVTDSGTRVGCIGWAVSVKGRPGYDHYGTIGEMTGLMGTSGFQGEGHSGAKIIEATAVRGVVYADSSGGSIDFARAGLFASDGVDGGSTIGENAAIYARAQRGTISNYSFYGELGELYNQNVIISPEQIAGGSKYRDLDGYITARVGGNGFEFGYPQAGAGGALGGTFSSGMPFLSFCGGADSTGDTFKTKGNLGTVIYNNLSGSTIFSRLTNANATGQTPVEDLRHRSDGKFSFNQNVILSLSNPPATASSSGEIGEVAWDSDYFYICVGANTWRRAALTTW